LVLGVGRFFKIFGPVIELIAVFVINLQLWPATSRQIEYYVMVLKYLSAGADSDIAIMH